MVPLKPEETLHNYLRRHFERIAKGNARQFAELKEVRSADLVPAARHSDGSGSQQPKLKEIMPVA